MLAEFLGACGSTEGGGEGGEGIMCLCCIAA